MRKTNEGTGEFGPSDHQVNDGQLPFTPGVPLDLSGSDDGACPNSPQGWFGSLRGALYRYETFEDPFGREFVVRTNEDTGERRKFIQPPSISLASDPF
jgi:hypothetical protein